MTEDNERKAAVEAYGAWDLACQDNREAFIADWLARARLTPKGEPVAWAVYDGDTPRTAEHGGYTRPASLRRTPRRS